MAARAALAVTHANVVGAAACVSLSAIAIANGGYFERTQRASALGLASEGQTVIASTDITADAGGNYSSTDSFPDPVRRWPGGHGDGDRPGQQHVRVFCLS